MSGFLIQVQADGVNRLVNELLAKAMDLGPLLEDFGEYMLARTEDCFVEQQDPWGNDWQDLAESTWKQKRNRKILTESTTLRSGIHYQVQGPVLTISTGLPSSAYAAIQQFGGLAGKGHRARIPARPYLAFTAADLQYLAKTALEYLL